jgi:hypothetical protein
MADRENVLNDLNKDISDRTGSEESSAAREEWFQIGQVLPIYSRYLAEDIFNQSKARNRVRLGCIQ